MQLFIKIILGLLLFALPVKAEEVKESTCVLYIIQEKGKIKIVKMQGDCKNQSAKQIYVHLKPNKETI